MGIRPQAGHNKNHRLSRRAFAALPGRPVKNGTYAKKKSGLGSRLRPAVVTVIVVRTLKDMHMTIFDNYAARYERTREEEYSLSEYLALCKKDPLTYASA